jgi:hypothetical protein
VLSEITNLDALIGVFAVNTAMILFGLLIERVNQGRDEVTWAHPDGHRWPARRGRLAR